jgi:hypothetical protein
MAAPRALNECDIRPGAGGAGRPRSAGNTGCRMERVGSLRLLLLRPPHERQVRLNLQVNEIEEHVLYLQEAGGER